MSRPLGQIPEGVVLPTQYTDAAALTALSKLTFTVEVTTSETDRAVLTFSTQTYDPTEISVNGKSQTLWLPEEPETFGAAIIDTVFEGI